MCILDPYLFIVLTVVVLMVTVLLFAWFCAEVCHTRAPIRVRLLVSQGGLCSLWFQASCFRFHLQDEREPLLLDRKGLSFLTEVHPHWLLSLVDNDFKFGFSS